MMDAFLGSMESLLSAFDPSASVDLSLALRVLVAWILGAAIGWEREHAEKAAGLRTHILVALTSGMFVALGTIWISAPGGVSSPLRVDPNRAIQAVAIGIGFLGSGIVFFDQSRVRGLTTAASVWATAAIGVACGLGRYLLAVCATLLVLVTLRFLTRFDRNGTGGSGP